MSTIEFEALQRSVDAPTLTGRATRRTLNYAKDLLARVLRTQAPAKETSEAPTETCQGSDMWDLDDGSRDAKRRKWRNPTKQEWQNLHNDLDRGYVWNDEQWRVAWEYLHDQFRNNLVSDSHESEETVRHPFFPDRFLMPQAQEIDRLAINQAMFLFGVASPEDVGLRPGPDPELDQ